MALPEKIKTFVLNELHDIRALLKDGIRSGAYLYPFRGILYFLSHRTLWRPFLTRLSPTIVLGVVVTSTMFFFTYVPQAAILAFTSGPLAPFSAALLVLSESSTILTALSRGFLLGDALTDTFDGTLVARGHTDLVSRGRQIKLGSTDDPMSRLGNAIVKPFSGLSMASLFRPLIYLPLNFIPIVGSFMYIVGQGKRVGPISHQRYYQLKGWNSKKKDAWVKENRAAYASFGAAAFMLEMVPFGSLALAYTNTVGAALWASDLEKASSATDKGE